jgi:DNA repair exonuclease SbcCD ATPase subunit
MKIRLVNFRCYTDETFDFGDDGLVLISASSGYGKSTILMGIHFALFGTGTKVSSYGKTSCKVELEFDDLKIVRTKRPNRLVLTDDISEYEDAIAQEIINKKFGNTFDVTGYMSQNALNSFIIMSPSDKLEFLEKFAFKDVNLAEIKNRCASLIRQRNDILNKTITQLEMATKTFEELTEPVKVEFPLKGHPKNYEKLIKNEEIRKKNCDTIIKRSRDIIEKTQKELSDVRVFETLLKSKSDSIETLKDKLKTISTEETDIEYEGDEKLKTYKDTLKNFLSQKELLLLEDTYNNDKIKLDNMKHTEREKLKKELEHIKSSNWIEYNKEEAVAAIKDMKETLKDANKVSYLKKELKDCFVDEDKLQDKKRDLEKFRTDLDVKRQLLESIKKQKTIYKCPSCDNSLHFRENRLYLMENADVVETHDPENIKNDINELQSNIKKLENKIPEEETKIKRKCKLENDIENIVSQYEELNEDSLQEDLEYLENYYKAELVKEKKCTAIEQTISTNVFTAYESFEKELSNLEKKICKLRKTCDVVDMDINEEELRNVIIREEKYRDKLDKLTNTKTKLEDEKSIIDKQICEMKQKHITKYTTVKTEIELEDVIKESKDNIALKESEKEKHVSNLDEIRKYNEYDKEKKNYESWKQKVVDLQLIEKEDRNRYVGACILKEKILEAESISVANIVESINTHAQIYLDSFFVDSPIIVRLLPFKETKKATKPQINIEIQYKDMECDLSMLSGGELSRVVLAFTLALSEMFNTPMLMLDESTASLDQEATTNVFDCIKDNFKGKIVLIIAHQTVNGIFDKVIKLDAKDS